MKNIALTLVLTAAVVGCARQDSAGSPAAAASPAASSSPQAATPAPAAASDPAAAPAPAEAPSSGPSAAAPAATAGVAPAADSTQRKPEYREVTIPAGTTLALALKSAVASDTSKVEDPVRASLRRGVTIDGVQALPAGTTVTGHVTSAERSAKVKGRASVAFRFSQIETPGGGHEAIKTATVSRVAAATKKKDATKIGAGSAAGAIIGGIVGGGGGAAKGAVIGGGAGTAVVLSTRGDEVRLAAGTPVSVKLLSPLTVRVPLR